MDLFWEQKVNVWTQIFKPLLTPYDQRMCTIFNPNPQPLVDLSIIQIKIISSVQINLMITKTSRQYQLKQNMFFFIQSESRHHTPYTHFFDNHP
jgi:hypothetical protein